MNFKVLAIFCLIVISLALIAGCSWVEQLQVWKDGDSEPQIIEQEIIDETELISDSELIEDNSQAQPLQPLPDQELQPEQNASISEPTPLPEQQTPEASQNSADNRQIVLYFASGDGENLEGEIRSIPSQEGMARATVNQLIAGPQITGLMPTIPAATILEDINIKDGVCIVDFSGELTANHPGGLKNEQLTVYSIVNTLSQFDTIEQVKILVDGLEIDSLAGHVDVSEAMAPYNDLILE